MPHNGCLEGPLHTNCGAKGFGRLPPLKEVAPLQIDSLNSSGIIARVTSFDFDCRLQESRNNSVLVGPRAIVPSVVKWMEWKCSEIWGSGHRRTARSICSSAKRGKKKKKKEKVPHFALLGLSVQVRREKSVFTTVGLRQLFILCCV